MKNRIKIWALTAVLAFSAVSFGGCGFKIVWDDGKDTQAVSEENKTVLDENKSERYKEILGKLDKIDNIIDNYYLNDEAIDPQSLEDSLYSGYVAGLSEKYTAYYSAEEYERLKESTNGVYDGIGVIVSQNRDTMIIEVIKPFDGQPGAEAGMKPGDIIYKVNGTEVTGKDVNLVVADMKGEAGTTVDVTVYRPDTDEYIDMTIERKKIETPTVEHKMMDNAIGYVAVSSFDEVTVQQFSDAIDDLKQQGMKGLVIDIRDNPGGLLPTVCAMLDKLLPEGLLVYTEDKNGKKEENYADNKEVLDLPMAVIVNGNSASASEIFSAALQDYNWATIVGETTYGKGIVQVIVPLDDGSAIKLTTAKYYTPKGICIHGKGVSPDIEAAFDKESDKDTQLEAAVSDVMKQIEEAN